MAFTGQEQHDITLQEASKLTSNYRGTVPANSRLGGFFGRDAIQALLDQDGCVGIRYYYGIDDNGGKVLVVVGVTSDENDIIKAGCVCIEAAVPCPPYCGTANVLNS